MNRWLRKRSPTLVGAMADPADSTAVEACAEFRLQDCEATFKVKNFTAAVAATDTPYSGHNDFHEIASPPIMSAGDFKFAIVIVWGVDDRNRPDMNKKIGVCGRRVDHCSETCTLSMAWKLLNLQEGNSCSGVDRGYFRHSRGHDRGRLPWGESASTLVSLAEAFDPSRGWLHDGALHIRMKLSVVTYVQATNTPSVPQGGQLVLAEDLRRMLQDGNYSDVTIVVGEQVIDTHRVILAARSPVFDAMLRSNMKEGLAGKIIIEDLDPRAVRDMIGYLYTGDVKQETLDDDDMCANLLQAADRYKVSGLVTICAEVIAKKLSTLTVCDRLEFADMLGCSRLKSRCLTYIQQNISEVQRTEAYGKLSRRPALLMDIVAALCPPTKRRRCGGASSQDESSFERSDEWKTQ